jgi:hypothetical protein
MAQQPGEVPPEAANGGAEPITGGAESLASHALTIDPRTGLPKGEVAPASTAAVLSLVCGFLFFLGPLTGLPAIIAGVVALRQARADPAHVGGIGLALAGIVLGLFNLVFSAGVVLVLAVGLLT